MASRPVLTGNSLSPAAGIASDTPSYTLLGHWLERTRASRGHTLSDVQHILGLSETSLIYLRRAKGRLRASTRTALAAYLDVDVETIPLLCTTPAPAFTGANLRRHPHHDEYSRLAQEMDRVSRSRGHRLTDIVDELGVSSGTVWHIRRVGVAVRMRTAATVAHYIGCTPHDVQRWAQEAAVRTVVYPQITHVGTQYHPTISVDRGCERCPYLTPCRRDVLDRDGFAWCERLIAVDLDSEHLTLSRDA
jgi:transcriptional regulator with XRE-family HTH domain